MLKKRLLKLPVGHALLPDKIILLLLLYTKITEAAYPYKVTARTLRQLHGY